MTFAERSCRIDQKIVIVKRKGKDRNIYRGSIGKIISTYSEPCGFWAAFASLYACFRACWLVSLPACRCRSSSAVVLRLALPAAVVATLPARCWGRWGRSIQFVNCPFLFYESKFLTNQISRSNFRSNFRR